MNPIPALIGIALSSPTSAPERTTVVFEAGRQGAAWHWGIQGPEQVASVVKLAGAERKLRTITLRIFMHTTGKFTLTAAIYKVPDKLDEVAKLERPMWKKDVDLTFSRPGGDQVQFDKLNYTLPDEFVLSFSFKAVKDRKGVGGGGDIPLRLDGDGGKDRPVNPPSVGELGARAVFTVAGSNFTGWDQATKSGAYYVDAKIEATGDSKARPSR